MKICQGSFPATLRARNEKKNYLLIFTLEQLSAQIGDIFEIKNIFFSLGFCMPLHVKLGFTCPPLWNPSNMAAIGVQQNMTTKKVEKKSKKSRKKSRFFRKKK